LKLLFWRQPLSSGYALADLMPAGLSEGAAPILFASDRETLRCRLEPPCFLWSQLGFPRFQGGAFGALSAGPPVVMLSLL